MAVTVDPSGRFAYVANYGISNISVFAIDQATGTLTSDTTVAAGTNPGSITVDSSGRYVYVANGSSSNVSVFSINQTTGALTAVTAGTQPYSVAVTFIGGFKADYSSNSGSYTILKGKLTIGAGGRLNVEGMKVRAVAP